MKWGLNKTLKLAKTMSLVGLFIEMVALYGLIWYAPWVARLDATLGFVIPAQFLFMALIIVVLCLAYSVPLRGLFSLHDISNRDVSIEKRMQKIKTRMNYPIWQACGIWGLVVTSAIIMVGSVVIGG